ncbi:AraC family transcriptional regulator [Sodalis sp. RH16]|uniref:AraC family transcriptional regulator n=1 Tax=unclassified Sodalis (in: enterobacteria) TaxID=2636512 RepID=UPI0039B50241
MEPTWRKKYDTAQPERLEKMRYVELAYRQGERQHWHAHEQGQLIFTLKGVVRVLTERHIWTLAPRRALWLPGGMPHELHAINDVTTHNIYLFPPLTRDFWYDDVALQVTPLLYELIKSWHQAQQAAELNRVEMSTTLLLDELRRCPRATVCMVPLPRDRRVLSVCDTLLGEPENNDTLENWGNRVGASARTLARLFRDETGMGFSQWRQQLRLAEAVTHLAQGRPINLLANSLGYQSPSAFIAMFKKTLGETPRRYLSC